MSSLREVLMTAAYFLSAFAFIFGIKRMAHPKTARSGNQIAALAMLIAGAATLLDAHIVTYWSIILGTIVGGGIGWYFARGVKMTAMPQMVALFNGMGGGTAAIVAVAEYLKASGSAMNPGIAASVALGAIIGAVSLSGSIVAFGKLQELLPDRPLKIPGQMHINGFLLTAALIMGGLMVAGVSPVTSLLIATGLALVVGITGVLPIGGADMPVVIAMLNSATGVAAALTGFVVHNQLLVVAGALVGASGTLLTFMMARAMNRPVTNVLFSGFGSVVANAAARAAETRPFREASAEDVGVALAYARNVVVVPGYGLAVAQAQQIVKELAQELEERGVNVKFAIHPVAGRMPGHMNVVLADANIPYESLCEMEQINGEFDNTDVVLVIGANDVVNPAARSDPHSPIYGMPILDVDYARNVIVLKRSMNPGFAGIDNELFYRANTRMLFGDAKVSLLKLVQSVKLN